MILALALAVVNGTIAGTAASKAYDIGHDLVSPDVPPVGSDGGEH